MLTYETHNPYSHTVFLPDSLKGREYEKLSLNDKKIHDYSRYDSGVKVADMYVTKVVDKLDELGILSNTLIIITSDHRDQLWDRNPINLSTHGHTFNLDQVKVPLILYAPGLFPKSRIVKNVVRSLDIAPTIFDYLNFEIPYVHQGISCNQATNDF